MDSDSLFLCVDVQDQFVNNDLNNIVSNISEFINDLPSSVCVVTTYFENYEDSPWVKYMNWNQVMKEPTPVLDIQDEVENSFYRSCYSVFNHQPFVDFIENNNFSTIYIGGIDTDACVLATAFDAFDKNIKTVVVQDLCGSSGGENFHNSSISILNRNIGEDQVLNVSDIEL